LHPQAEAAAGTDSAKRCVRQESQSITFMKRIGKPQLPQVPLGDDFARGGEGTVVGWWVVCVTSSPFVAASMCQGRRLHIREAPSQHPNLFSGRLVISFRTLWGVCAADLRVRPRPRLPSSPAAQCCSGCAPGRTAPVPGARAIYMAAEVAQREASIWTVREGKIARAAFL
jgi:hypothetical protein